MTAFLVSLFAIWTVFGLFVIVSMINGVRRPSLSWKHMVLFGPVLGTGLFIVGAFLKGVDVAAKWAEDKK
jgi:uncharacterized protein (DUF983 family)